MSDRPRIERVHIEGFRSLANVTLEPGPGVTVLIGPNGAGKSNFFRFFELVQAMLGPGGLRRFVGSKGGADDQLFGGGKRTREWTAAVRVTNGGAPAEYEFTLAHEEPDMFRFAEERFRQSATDSGEPEPWTDLGSGHDEAGLISRAHGPERRDDRPAARAISDALQDTANYHFHDTTSTSSLKKVWDERDDFRLRPDGGNLAAVLLRMAREDRPRYDRICHCIGRVLPGFANFDIQPEFGTVFLYWKIEGSDKRIGAHLTSDGSLRFFALATLLNQSIEALPGILFLDEPELGLHPAAIPLLGGLLRSLGRERQIIVATQSSLLLDEFEIEDTRIFDYAEGQTRVRLLDPADYRDWLDDRSLGELWETNLLGGGP